MKNNPNIESSSQQAPKKKRFKMPSAYVIVFAALLITVVMTYFVPVSVYDKHTGEVIYNAMLDDEGYLIEDVGPQPDGLWDLLMAPIRGFVSASDVGVALLIAGGFLNLLALSGGLEAGIGKLLSRMKGNVLIALMTLVFAILGTVFGLWEEIPAFAIVVVPLFIIAGYDAMTGLAILFMGATIGNMASVVNPFSTGAAVAAINNPNLTLGSGIILRGVLFVVLYVVGTVFILQYAAMVKNNKEKSVLADLTDIKMPVQQDTTLPEMNPQRRNSLIIFIAMVLLLLIGYIPWEAIGGENLYRIVNLPFTALEKVPLLGNVLGAGHITRFGEWGFSEFSFLFFAGSLLLKLVNKYSMDDFLKHFIDGAKDLLGVVLVLAIARGIAIVMGDSSSGMSVTFVFWISNALSSAPLWIFGVFAMLAYVSIGLFLQSTSGVAGISMPILGAVASALFIASPVGSIGGQIILISAFTCGVNFMSGLYPGATTMGTLELFNIPYDKYLKFMLPRLIVLLLISAVIISVAPYIGLAQ